MKLGRWVIVAVLLSSLPVFAASGSFQLKIFEGYNFASRTVGKSGGSSDLSFTYQVRRTGMISYLQAPKIKEFLYENHNVTAAEVNGWEDYVAGPSPDYYVIRANDGRLYLLQLKSFENQGKAAAYWILTFDWEELPQGGGQDATQPSRKTQRESPSVPSRSTPPSGGGTSNDGFLVDTGRKDGMETLQERVVIEFTVQSSLTVGWRGQIYGISAYRPGETKSLRMSIFDNKRWASLSLSPGTYDIWVQSGDYRLKFIHRVDLTNLKVGEIYAATVHVEDFDVTVEDMRNGRVKPPATSVSRPPAQPPATPETATRRPATAILAEIDADRKELRRKLSALDEEQALTDTNYRKKIQALEAEYESRIAELRRQMQVDDEQFESDRKSLRSLIQTLDEEYAYTERERVRK